jgi:hypothetical protein
MSICVITSDLCLTTRLRCYQLGFSHLKLLCENEHFFFSSFFLLSILIIQSEGFHCDISIHAYFVYSPHYSFSHPRTN